MKKNEQTRDVRDLVSAICVASAALGLLIYPITQKKSFLFPDPVSFIGVIVVMHRKSEKINRQ